MLGNQCGIYIENLPKKGGMYYDVRRVLTLDKQT